MANKGVQLIGIVVAVLITIILVPVVVDQVQTTDDSVEQQTGRVWIALPGLAEDIEYYNGTDGASYGDVRNASAADSTDYSSNGMRIGQNITDGNYTVYRSGVFFNLTQIVDKIEGENIAYVPSGESDVYTGDIYDAKLALNLDANNTTTDFELTVQYDSDNVYPNYTAIAGGSPNASDYNLSYYAGTLGVFDTNNLPAVDADFNTTLNSAALDYMMNYEGEIIRYMLRSANDIQNTAPTDMEYISVHQQDDTGTTTPTLYLQVGYYESSGWDSFTGGSGARTLFLLLPFIFIAGVVLYYLQRMM